MYNTIFGSPRDCLWIHCKWSLQNVVLYFKFICHKAWNKIQQGQPPSHQLFLLGLKGTTATEEGTVAKIIRLHKGFQGSKWFLKIRCICTGHMWHSEWLQPQMANTGKFCANNNLTAKSYHNVTFKHFEPWQCIENNWWIFMMLLHFLTRWTIICFHALKVYSDSTVIYELHCI